MIERYFAQNSLVVEHLGCDIVLGMQMFPWNFAHIADDTQIVHNYGMELIPISQRHCELHLELTACIQTVDRTIVHLTAAIDVGQIGRYLRIEFPQRAAIVADNACL